MNRYFAISLILSTCWAVVAEAEWIWTPDTGWINTRHAKQKAPKELMAQGERLAVQKHYLQAARTFAQVFEYYPASPETEHALLAGAQNYILAGEDYQAHLLNSEYLKRYPNSPHTAEVLKREYQIGRRLLQAHNDKGLEILQHVIDRSPYQEFSDDALLAMANYYYENKAYEDAQEHYEKLLKEYKDSEWRGMARYQLAMCAFYRFEGPPYDTTPIHKAREHLQQYLQDYPQEALSAQAREKLKQVELILARKELAIAKFYLSWGHVSSAKLYLRSILREYPHSPVAMEAIGLLESLGERVPPR